MAGVFAPFREEDDPQFALPPPPVLPKRTDAQGAPSPAARPPQPTVDDSAQDYSDYELPPPPRLPKAQAQPQKQGMFSRMFGGKPGFLSRIFGDKESDLTLSDLVTGRAKPVQAAQPPTRTDDDRTAEAIGYDQRVPQRPVEPQEFVPMDEGAFRSGLRSFSTGIIPNTAAAVGSVKGTALGAFTTPVTGPVGPIAGSISGASIGHMGGSKAQRELVRAIQGDEGLRNLDKQLAYNAEQHPIASGVGSMLAALPLLLAPSKIKEYVGKRGANAVMKVGMTAAEKQAAYQGLQTAANARLPRVLANATRWAGLESAPEFTRRWVYEDPDAEPFAAIPRGAFKGMVVGEVATLVGKGIEAGASRLNLAWAAQVPPHVAPYLKPAAQYLGGIFIEAPSMALTISTAEALYDMAVKGKPFDQHEVLKDTWMALPSYMAMQMVLGAKLLKVKSGLPVAPGELKEAKQQYQKHNPAWKEYIRNYAKANGGRMPPEAQVIMSGFLTPEQAGTTAQKVAEVAKKYGMPYTPPTWAEPQRGPAAGQPKTQGQPPAAKPPASQPAPTAQPSPARPAAPTVSQVAYAALRDGAGSQADDALKAAIEDPEGLIAAIQAEIDARIAQEASGDQDAPTPAPIVPDAPTGQPAAQPPPISAPQAPAGNRPPSAPAPMPASTAAPALSAETTPPGTPPADRGAAPISKERAEADRIMANDPEKYRFQDDITPSEIDGIWGEAQTIQDERKEANAPERSQIQKELASLKGKRKGPDAQRKKDIQDRLEELDALEAEPMARAEAAYAVAQEELAQRIIAKAKAAGIDVSKIDEDAMYDEISNLSDGRMNESGWNKPLVDQGVELIREMAGEQQPEAKPAAKPPELMTPDEFRKEYPGYAGIQFRRQDYASEESAMIEWRKEWAREYPGITPVIQKINDRVVGGPRFKMRAKISPLDRHAKSVRAAIAAQKPVAASAVDAYGIALPEGYVRSGDRYAYLPASPAVPEGATAPQPEPSDAQAARGPTADKPAPLRKGQAVRYKGEDYYVAAKQPRLLAKQGLVSIVKASTGAETTVRREALGEKKAEEAVAPASKPIGGKVRIKVKHVSGVPPFGGGIIEVEGTAVKIESAPQEFEYVAYKMGNGKWRIVEKTTGLSFGPYTQKTLKGAIAEANRAAQKVKPETFRQAVGSQEKINGGQPEQTKQPEVTPQTKSSKEPWEMTVKEFSDSIESGSDFLDMTNLDTTEAENIAFAGDIQKFNTVEMAHRVYVRRAIAANKPVPAEVLADYPDLKPKVAEKPKAPPSGLSVPSVESSKEKYADWGIKEQIMALAPAGRRSAGRLSNALKAAGVPHQFGPPRTLGSKRSSVKIPNTQEAINIVRRMGGTISKQQPHWLTEGKVSYEQKPTLDYMGKKRREWIDSVRKKNPLFAPDFDSWKELLSPEDLLEVQEYEDLRYRSVAKQGPETGYASYKLTEKEKARLAVLEKKIQSAYSSRSTEETPAPVSSPAPDGKTIEVPMSPKQEAKVTPKEQKKYFIAEIDKAIAEAPEDAPEEGYYPKEPEAADIENNVKVYDRNKVKFGTVTIEVPGDGTFTVLNSKVSLQNLKDRVSAMFPAKAPTATAPSMPSTKPSAIAKVEKRPGASVKPKWDKLMDSFASRDKKSPLLVKPNYNGANGEVVATDSRRLVVALGVKTGAKPVEGYPNYAQIVPGYRRGKLPEIQSNQREATVADTEKIIRQIRQAGLATQDKRADAYIGLYRMPDETVAVTSVDAQGKHGDGYVSQPVDSGELIGVFNAGFLDEAFTFMRKTGNASATLRWLDEVSPAILLGAKEYVVLMPIRGSASDLETVAGIIPGGRMESAKGWTAEVVIDPIVGKEWNSPYGRQRVKSVEPKASPEHIQYADVETVGTGAIRRYKLAEIDEVAKRNELETTPEYKAKRESEKQKIESDRAADEAKAKAESETAAKIAEYVGTLGLPKLQADRMAHLLKQVAGYDVGGTSTYRGQRAVVVGQLLDAGYKPETKQVNAIQPMTRTQFNRASAAEQAAHDKRMAMGEKKTEYRFVYPSGSYFATTKAEHDYAVWLDGQRAQAAETAQPEQETPVEALRSAARAAGLPDAGTKKDLETRFAAAGLKAATANAGQHQEATKMESSGESREAIWRQTGWWKGPDGQWRFEIDDSQMKVLPELKNTFKNRKHAGKTTVDSVSYRQNDDGTFDVSFRKKDAQTTEDFITYSRLTGDELVEMLGPEAQRVISGMGEPTPWGWTDAEFKAPSGKLIDLPGIEMRVDDGIRLSAAIDHPELFRAYPQLKNVIVGFVGKNEWNGPQGMLAKTDDGTPVILVNNNDARWGKTLLHEIQHAIQEIEGYAMGGSIEGVQSMRGDPSQRLADLRQSDPSADAWLIEQDRIIDATADGQLDAALKAHRETAPKSLLRFWDESRRLSGTDENAYRRLAGEVESRFVQRRIDMPPMQRKAVPPWQTMETMLREEGLLKPGQKPEDALIFRKGFAGSPAESRMETEYGTKPTAESTGGAVRQANQPDNAQRDADDLRSRERWERGLGRAQRAEAGVPEGTEIPANFPGTLGKVGIDANAGKTDAFRRISRLFSEAVPVDDNLAFSGLVTKEGLALFPSRTINGPNAESVAKHELFHAQADKGVVDIQSLRKAVKIHSPQFQEYRNRLAQVRARNLVESGIDPAIAEAAARQSLSLDESRDEYLADHFADNWQVGGPLFDLAEGFRESQRDLVRAIKEKFSADAARRMDENMFAADDRQSTVGEGYEPNQDQSATAQEGARTIPTGTAVQGRRGVFVAGDDGAVGQAVRGRREAARILENAQASSAGSGVGPLRIANRPDPALADIEARAQAAGHEVYLVEGGPMGAVATSGRIFIDTGHTTAENAEGRIAHELVHDRAKVGDEAIPFMRRALIKTSAGYKAAVNRLRDMYFPGFAAMAVDNGVPGNQQVIWAMNRLEEYIKNNSDEEIAAYFVEQTARGFNPYGDNDWGAAFGMRRKQMDRVAASMLERTGYERAAEGFRLADKRGKQASGEVARPAAAEASAPLGQMQDTGVGLPQGPPQAATETDRAYLDAVEAGDVATAQRMVDEAAIRKIDDAVLSAKRELDERSESNDFIQVDWDFEDRPEDNQKIWFPRPELPKHIEFLDEDVPRDSIEEIDGKYVLDENPTLYDSLEDAKSEYESMLRQWAEEVDTSGSFGQSMSGHDVSSKVFDAFPQHPAILEEWHDTKWGSWYLRFRDQDGAIRKISVRDHDASRKDMGIPDKVFYVEKSWTPDDVGAALIRAWKYIQDNSADPIVRDDAGRIIPPSERFNQKSDDIRFSVPAPGTKAAERIRKQLDAGQYKAAQIASYAKKGGGDAWRITDENGRVLQSGFATENEARERMIYTMARLENAAADLAGQDRYGVDAVLDARKAVIETLNEDFASKADFTVKATESLLKFASAITRQRGFPRKDVNALSIVRKHVPAVVKAYLKGKGEARYAKATEAIDAAMYEAATAVREKKQHADAVASFTKMVRRINKFGIDQFAPENKDAIEGLVGDIAMKAMKDDAALRDAIDELRSDPEITAEESAELGNLLPKRPKDMTIDELRYITANLELVLEDQKEKKAVAHKALRDEAHMPRNEFIEHAKRTKGVDFKEVQKELSAFDRPGQAEAAWATRAGTVAYFMDGKDDGPLYRLTQGNFLDAYRRGLEIKKISELKRIEMMGEEFDFRTLMDTKDTPTSLRARPRRYVLDSGETLIVSPDRMVAIHEMTLNPDNMRHATDAKRGGIVYKDSQSMTPIVMSESDMHRIAADVAADPVLSKAAAYIHFVNNEIHNKEGLNPISMRMDAHEIANEPNYFPIKTAAPHRKKQDIQSDEPSPASIGNTRPRSVESAGPLHKRLPSARGPIVLMGAFESLQESEQVVARYQYAPALRILKLAKEPAYDADGNYIGNLEGAVKTGWSKLYWKNVMDLADRIENPPPNETADNWVNWAHNRATVGQLTGNIAVYAYQPVSYVGALPYFEVQDWVAGGMKPAASWEKMGRYSPELYFRGRGKGSDLALAAVYKGRPHSEYAAAIKQINDMREAGEITLGDSLMLKASMVNEATWNLAQRGMTPITEMDRQAIGRIFNSAEIEAKRLNPSITDEEALMAAGRKTDHIIFRSQPASAGEHRSMLQRLPGFGWRFMMRFSSQRTAYHTMLLRANYDRITGKINNTEYLKHMFSLLASQIAIAAVKTLVGRLLYRYEKGDEWKYFSAQVVASMMSLGGIGGDMIYQFYNAIFKRFGQPMSNPIVDGIVQTASGMARLPKAIADGDKKRIASSSRQLARGLGSTLLPGIHSFMEPAFSAYQHTLDETSDNPGPYRYPWDQPAYKLPWER